MPARTLKDKLWILIAALTICGCGGGKYPTYRAGGRVTFADGKPLTTGWISFRALDSENVTARGQIQPDGTFELTTFTRGDGAVEGRHQALVMAQVYRNEREAPQGTPPPPPLIDTRFSSFESSGLEFTVTNVPEQNQFNIQVTPP